jgi:hypothetical protein
LEKTIPALRCHPDVLEIRLQIYAEVGKWEQCIDIGNALVRFAPEVAFGTVPPVLVLNARENVRFFTLGFRAELPLYLRIYFITAWVRERTCSFS